MIQGTYTLFTLTLIQNRYMNESILPVLNGKIDFHISYIDIYDVFIKHGLGFNKKKLDIVLEERKDSNWFRRQTVSMLLSDCLLENVRSK